MRSLTRAPATAIVFGAVTVMVSGCGLLRFQDRYVAPPTVVSQSPTSTPTPTPTSTPAAVPPPTATVTPEPPPSPTPPNPMGGQTDGGNTSNTPLVEDTGPQPFATGPAVPVSDYEFTYTVQKNDQLLAIASRFQLQTVDVVRVNFPCTDPTNVQPGDVLDIRWPTDSEVIGSGTKTQGC
jgi:hypothetical protein